MSGLHKRLGVRQQTYEVQQECPGEIEMSTVGVFILF